jgi:predicted metal-dependent hydrolase
LAEDLPFLAGYPAELQDPVRQALAAGTLGAWLQQRYPQQHGVRSDTQLYARAQALRQGHLRHAGPLAKVVFNNRMSASPAAIATLGTMTRVSRVQGGSLKAKQEIRISAVFKAAPAAMLDMILVHELAHLKEREHDKAFYALCRHMLPDYHQIEFDTRVWLCWQAHQAAEPAPALHDSVTAASRTGARPA